MRLGVYWLVLHQHGFDEPQCVGAMTHRKSGGFTNEITVELVSEWCREVEHHLLDIFGDVDSTSGIDATIAHCVPNSAQHEWRG